MFQCTGKNQAGSIQAAARLQIIEQGIIFLLLFYAIFLRENKGSGSNMVYVLALGVSNVVRLMLIYNMNICYVFYNFVHIISILYIVYF